MPLRLTTYYKSKDIPDLPGNDIFHSTELFKIYEATKGYTPILLVAYQNNEPVAKILATTRRSSRFFSPSLIKKCDIYGNGEYFSQEIDQEEVFGVLLKHLTKEIFRTANLIEVRNLPTGLTGYKHFRTNKYFAMNWLRVRNSLHHDKPIETRFSNSRIRQIKKGIKNGAEISEIHSLEEIQEFSKMLKRLYSVHLRKHFPHIEFFEHLENWMGLTNQGNIFAVKHKGKIIGGAVCVYSGENAYLWFSGGMRKTYALQYPGVLAVWAALKKTQEKGFKHLEFMDVGLPFRKHTYRDFVLRFGGKQSSTRRWFKFKNNFINNILLKLYR